MSPRILYVWLPCKPIYPVGIGYLVSYVHHRLPGVTQRVLDLSLIPPRKRLSTLLETCEAFRPDWVAFSWRDIQVYAPHEGDASLEAAFQFYYSPNPLERIRAAWLGLKMVWGYRNQIQEKLRLIRETMRRYRQCQFLVGGGAFSVFPEPILRRLPPGIIGVIGEGEEVVVDALQGKSLEAHRVVWREGDQIHRGTPQRLTPLEDLQLDLSYLESVYPQVRAYQGTPIGIQTKRGCPYRCAFCLYNYIEGYSVRLRPPERVFQEVEAFYHQWGVRQFWFADAQFVPGSRALEQVEAILDRIIHSRMELTWSSYIRTSLITESLAQRMVRSGVGDLEVSITSGSQRVLNGLRMGFRLERLYEGCRHLKKAGYRGTVILNYSLNAPGETRESLLECVASYRRLVEILGEDQVLPMLFFLGVQPHTPLEEMLLEEGYLDPDYDPLALNPFTIRKLLYNPPPLGPIIARACLKGWRQEGAFAGRTILLELERALAA